MDGPARNDGRGRHDAPALETPPAAPVGPGRITARRAFAWRLEDGPREGVRLASHVVHETWSEAPALVRVFEVEAHLRGRLWIGRGRHGNRAAAIRAAADLRAARRTA